MTRGAAAAAMFAALSAAGCVDEYDVDAYVVLPARCDQVGAARAAIAVTTADGESFAIVAPACTDQLAGQDASGFAATIERVTADYHRADVAIEDAAGARIGGRSLPFAGDRPLILALARPDLPAWPVAAITVTIPACVAGGVVAELRLTATPAGGVAPEVDTVVACTSPAPAPIAIALPRGPAEVVAEAPCWRGTVDTEVEDGGEIAVELTGRSCP